MAETTYRTGYPTDDILKSGLRIQAGEFDSREQAEREEAVTRYFGEDERHFIDYLEDCRRQSENSSRGIRRDWSECYRVYKEKEPGFYAGKEEWQSRMVVPMPYRAIEYGASAIEDSFQPDFLSIQDAKDKTAEAFWRRVMEVQTDEAHSRFVRRYGDAVKMALAIGQSMEMITRWEPGRGLRFQLVEPWKIYRDPDAPPRDPQGGMFWIHTEWLDWWLLKKNEQRGVYQNIDSIKNFTQNELAEDPSLSRDAIAERRDQYVWGRSRYRTMVRVDEFYGVVLSPAGEELLPRATYTMGGRRIIRPPRPVKYPTLRWPGVSFSPLPDMIRYGGRGFLKSVISVWNAMNNLVCLHNDSMNWLVNPPSEVNTDVLVDPEDVEDWPGKKYQVNTTMNGQPAVRTIDRRDHTNSVLANSQYFEQLFNNGSFTQDVIQGLPGYRQEVTWREKQMNLQQSMGVYGLMGKSLEEGAVEVMNMALEVIRTFCSYEEYMEMMDDAFLMDTGIMLGVSEYGELLNLPEFSGRFHISGIRRMMKDADALRNIIDVWLPMMDRPWAAPYIDSYNLLRAIEKRTELMDEEILKDAEEAGRLDARQELMEEQARESGEMMPEAGAPSSEGGYE